MRVAIWLAAVDPAIHRVYGSDPSAVVDCGPCNGTCSSDVQPVCEPCPIGTFALSIPKFQVGKVCAPCAPAGEISPDMRYQSEPGADICLQCPPGGNCSADSAVSQRGFWRLEDTFYECVDPLTCGGNNTCLDGASGALCYRCPINHVKTVAFLGCQECIPMGWLITLLILVCIIAFVGLTVLIRVIDRGTTKLRDLTSPIFKIFLNYLQMGMVVFTSTKLLEEFMALMPVTTAGEATTDLGFGMIGVGCVFGTGPDAAYVTFVTTVAAWVATPILLSAFMIARYLFDPSTLPFIGHRYTVTVTDHEDEEETDEEMDEFVRAHKRKTKLKRDTTSGQAEKAPVIESEGAIDKQEIITLYLAYPAIMKLLCKITDCVQYDKLRVRAEPEIVCFEGDHYSMFLFAIFGIVIWGLGVPWYLYHKLAVNEERLREPFMRRKFGFLYDGFENDKYYFESVFLLRKLLFFMIGSFPVSAEGRTVLLLAISVIFMALHIYQQPFDNRAYMMLDRLESRALYVICFTLVAKLLIVHTDVGAWVLYLTLFSHVWTTMFFAYALMRTFTMKTFGHKLVEKGLMKINMMQVEIGDEGVEIDVSQLSDMERNFLCSVVAELMDTLNDTDKRVSFHKLGLFLRAAVSYELQRQYHGHLASAEQHHSEKKTLNEKVREAATKLVQLAREKLSAKKPAGGRGSFMQPIPLEGEVSVEELHNACLQITPFVVNGTIDLQRFGPMENDDKERSEAVLENMNRLKEKRVSALESHVDHWTADKLRRTEMAALDRSERTKAAGLTTAAAGGARAAAARAQAARAQMRRSLSDEDEPSAEAGMAPTKPEPARSQYLVGPEEPEAEWPAGSDSDAPAGGTSTEFSTDDEGGPEWRSVDSRRDSLFSEAGGPSDMYQPAVPALHHHESMRPAFITPPVRSPTSTAFVPPPRPEERLAVLGSIGMGNHVTHNL